MLALRRHHRGPILAEDARVFTFSIHGEKNYLAAIAAGLVETLSRAAPRSAALLVLAAARARRRRRAQSGSPR